MNRLVTIPVSPFCEKARWALDLSSVPYVEEGHMPMLHWRRSYGAGGRQTVPVLALEGSPTLCDSSDIVEALAARAPEQALYGTTPEEGRQIRDWEERFDTGLGPHVRRWAYHHLFPAKASLLAIFRWGVPAWEVRLFSAMYPVAQLMMRKAMRIDQPGFERSLVKIEACLGAVEAALADGRPYLMGERFTAADLTFASMASVITIPPELPVPMPERATLPAKMAEQIERYQRRPAGRFALRLYAERRPRRPPVGDQRLLPG